MVKQFSDEVSTQSATYSKFLKGQNRINENKISYPKINFDKQINDYEASLAKRCTALGIKFIDYPSITHREIVKREWAKRKPFKDSGDRDLSLVTFDTPQGYMDRFAGVMTGIRNPKAHDNESITKEDALRKLIMISLLLFKIDLRV